MIPIEQRESPGLGSLWPVTPEDESYTNKMPGGDCTLVLWVYVRCSRTITCATINLSVTTDAESPHCSYMH